MSPLAEEQPNMDVDLNANEKKTAVETLTYEMPPPSAVRIKLRGKWVLLSEEFVATHPGGSVIHQYRDADATQIFDAFHEGSPSAYKQLDLVLARNVIDFPGADPTLNDAVVAKSTNVGAYNISIEEEKKIVISFERLKSKIAAQGLMNERPLYYARKSAEVFALMLTSFVLQYAGWYLPSALFLATCWQQLGWLTHEFCHHQPFKNRRVNDWMSLFFGNFMQGFSRDWWKDKHNTHHAATNIVDQDGDIDLAPLIAMVPDDLARYKQPLERLLLRFIPYQHLYFTLTLPLLRVSWTTQSIIHCLSAAESRYAKDRKHAAVEQLALSLHWLWVAVQLYFLPDNATRLTYFLTSQLLGGLFIAVVVTYNHNSVEKFPEHSRLLNNFAALHIFTTRNMNPGVFTDWFWGGLNYQIEHHLFPTMPRPNLNQCSRLVKEFCAENKLPYLVDDYKTGYLASLRLLENVSKLADKQQSH